MSESRQFHFVDRQELAAGQLLERVRELLSQGNVRTLTVRSESGDIMLSVPLTAGAVAGGVVVLTAPWLALLAAAAGVLARVRIDVTYEGPEQSSAPENGEDHD